MKGVMLFLVVVLTAVLTCACGPRRVGVPTPPGQDLFVLLPDPDAGTVGRVTASNRSGVAELSKVWDSTVVAQNRPPTPVTTMDPAEVQRVFGDALSSLPAPPLHFNVYFEYGSNDLTRESRTLIPEILRVVGARLVPDVLAVGHTDTTGRAASNNELGLKRAMIVRDLLIASGLDASLIEITSHGEADLLIPTPDETYEPRNRRVDIEVR
jgi:outer membrane protein OmpA-like peptidoglycan-associated protein